MSSKPLPNPWFLLYFLSIIKSVSCLLFSTQTPQINTAKDYELKSLILSKTKQFPSFHLFSLLHWSQIWETKQHRGFGLVPIPLSMYTVLLGRCLMALVSPAYSGLDFNPSFTCTALHMAYPRFPRAFSQGLP